MGSGLLDDFSPQLGDDIDLHQRICRTPIRRTPSPGGIDLDQGNLRWERHC